MTRWYELVFVVVSAALLANCGGSSLEADEPQPATTTQPADSAKGEPLEPTAAAPQSDADSASEVSDEETVESTEEETTDDSDDSGDVSDVIDDGSGGDDANLIQEDPDDDDE